MKVKPKVFFNGCQFFFDFFFYRFHFRSSVNEPLKLFWLFFHRWISSSWRNSRVHLFYNLFTKYVKTRPTHWLDDTFSSHKIEDWETQKKILLFSMCCCIEFIHKEPRRINFITFIEKLLNKSDAMRGIQFLRQSLFPHHWFFVGSMSLSKMLYRGGSRISHKRRRQPIHERNQPYIFYLWNPYEIGEVLIH